MEKIELDTGVISLYLTQDITEEIKTLFSKIKSGTIEAYCVKPILTEVFYHLCQKRGLESAKAIFFAFLTQTPLIKIDLTEDLIARAGTLKYQCKDRLSYIDCMAIAHALQMKIPLHTTEKKFHKISLEIIKKMTVEKYRFD